MNGYYPVDRPPRAGLAAARMAALLTYRSRDSFESRFGRRSQAIKDSVMTPPDSPRSPEQEAIAIHNDGHRSSSNLNASSSPRKETSHSSSETQRPIFSAQSYLRYQGDKFISRFDANCYIHITRKMDTHDITRGKYDPKAESNALSLALSKLPPRALVIGIQTDGLFMISEQREIAEGIPDAELVVIDSIDGHDGFLLEFEQINAHILKYLHKEFSSYYDINVPEETCDSFEVKKSSMFGEAEDEADITRW